MINFPKIISTDFENLFYSHAGAYYWYNTEKGQHYQQTVFDIKTYADKMKIPYRYNHQLEF